MGYIGLYSISYIGLYCISYIATKPLFVSIQVMTHKFLVCKIEELLLSEMDFKSESKIHLSTFFSSSQQCFTANMDRQHLRIRNNNRHNVFLMEKCDGITRNCM